MPPLPHSLAYGLTPLVCIRANRTFFAAGVAPQYVTITITPAGVILTAVFPTRYATDVRGESTSTSNARYTFFGTVHTYGIMVGCIAPLRKLLIDEGAPLRWALDAMGLLGAGGVPLVVYNRSDPALPMAVLSQLDWPKAQHVSSSASVVGFGVKATVDRIPAGWSHRVVLSFGDGIGAGMLAWGDLMLAALCGL